MRFVAAAVVAGVSALALASLVHQDATKTGAVTLGRAAPLSGYRIAYRIKQGDRSADAETLVVDRPWRSLKRSVNFVQVSDFGALGNRPVRADESGFVTPPAIAAGDSRPEIALPAAVAAGVATLGEERRVLGHSCQIYRTGYPLDAGPITRPGADRAESCVDRRGLVLEEVLVVDEKPVQRRVATAVRPRARLGAADVRVAPAAQSVDQGGASVRAITAAEAATLSRWTLEMPPAFVLQGQFGVVNPARGIGDDPRAAFSRLAVVTTVWTRGPDVVIFEAGATLDSSSVAPIPFVKKLHWPSPSDGKTPGSSTLSLSARGNELRSSNSADWVRLTATVDPERLLELAAGIRWGGQP